MLGVHFEVIPFKQATQQKPPKPKRHHVQALPEKAGYRIDFPRVEGYQRAIRDLIAVDWERVPPVIVDPMRIPDEVQVKAALPS